MRPGVGDQVEVGDVAGYGVRLGPTPDDIMALTLELVAHEVRSPLCSSRRTIERLLQEHADDEVVLRSLLDALERIGHTVDDLLGLEALDSSAGTTSIALDELAGSCVAACALPDQVDLLVVPTIVEAHVGLLRPAIVNLLDNALRHRRSEVLLHAGAMDSGTLVMVDDDGPGIPPDLRELVFRPLVRLDPNAGEGAGIGLALVRRVAELHGGRAWAEEAPSGGARFCLWLPDASTLAPGPLRPEASRVASPVAWDPGSLWCRTSLGTPLP